MTFLLASAPVDEFPDNRSRAGERKPLPPVCDGRGFAFGTSKRELTAKSVQGPEGVVEYPVSDVAPLVDALSLVEGPVNAEIDSALAVLFFCL